MKIHYLILLTFVFALSLANAQEQLVHKKKIYIDKNQHLYVQDSLPVYVFLSTSPDATEAVQLKSEKSAKYVNPMYFDGHGKHNFTHKDYDHETEVSFEVYADGISPQTHIALNKAPSHQSDTKLFYGKNLDIVLSATDEMSGVENIYYSINGANFQKYDKNILLEQESEYILKYYAVDNVGNTEKIHSKSFTVDVSEPKTELTINGDHKDDVLSPHATIHLKGEDEQSGLSGILYNIDKSPNVTYTSQIHIGSLIEGEHTITYFGIDYLKNKETSKEYTFYIDKTPPIVIEDVIGDKYLVNKKEFSSGRTKVKLTAIDNKSGVNAIYYSINGASFQPYSDPFEVPNHSGTVSIKSYAIDNVMNKSSNSEESNTNLKMSYVDLSGPDLHHTFQGPVFKTRDTLFISGKTKISLKGTDLESGFNKITYNLDQLGDVEYANSFSITKESRHFIEYIGYDNVNNSNNSSFYFDVDNTGPEIFFQFSIVPIGNSNGKDIYPGHVVVFLSATDGLVGYDKMYFSVNGATEKLFTGTIDGFQKNKTYTIKVRAIDKLGNESTKETVFKTESSKSAK